VSISDVGGAALDFNCSDFGMRCFAEILGGWGNGANSITRTKIKNKMGRNTKKMSMVKYRPSFKSVAAVLYACLKMSFKSPHNPLPGGSTFAGLWI